MLKKWWFYVIVAVVIILIAVPLSTIASLNKSVYDLGFNYVKLDDPLTEIAKKNVYYEAATQTLEIEINQDFINSMLRDQLAQLDLGLPDKLTIQEAAFNTSDQRLYINAKYGSINLPISAKVNIVTNDSGITVSADNFNLGQKKAPGYVTKMIPKDQLTFSFQYSDLADLGIPLVFSVKDIKYSTGNINVFVELNADKIKEMARDYRNELQLSINDLKRDQSETVKTFIDRVLAEGLLSDKNVNDLVDKILDNEELVNSAILFALAPDLDKYSKGLEEYSQAVVDWVAPISGLSFEGSLEEIVEGILYNAELKDMLAWFIPAATLTDYADTADTYYTVYKEAQGSLTTLGIALENGDIEMAVRQIVADKDLYKALTTVMPADSVNYYISSISGYYNMYVDITKSLTEALAAIPDDKITEYVQEAIKYVYQIDEGQQNLLNILTSIDTKVVQDIVAYCNSDEGVIHDYISMINPTDYDVFMLYVDNLDTVKADIIKSIKGADIDAVKEGADIINDINDDLMYVLKLLRNQDYEKAGDAMGKISFDKADSFIKKQTGQL